MEARAPGTYRQTKTDKDRQRQTQAKKYTDRQTERNDTERQTERRREKDKDSNNYLLFVKDRHNVIIIGKQRQTDRQTQTVG